MRNFWTSASFWLLLCYVSTGFGQTLPIKPARTISFSTTEGTEMDVDVSPDGKTLAFDLLGDLYTLPVTGGIAKQLTRGMAIHMQPQWSPDGKMLAYFSDSSGSMHLTVRDLRGSFQRTLGLSEEQVFIANNLILTWTPDGHCVTYDHSLYGITGGNQFLPKNTAPPIRFSADGRSFYYADVDSKKLVCYDSEQRSRTPLSEGLKFSWRYELSPNLRWLAYTADSSGKRCMLIRNLVNNKERILVPCIAEHPLLTIPHFAFSPDSKAVYICYGGKIHRLEVESGKNRVIPFTANVKVDAGPFDYNTFGVSHEPFKIKYTRSANASPDGKHLVFQALNKIWIMDLPNGIPHVLVPQSIGQFQPIFSPDSKWVAYVSWCDSTGGQLWRVATAGGVPEQITKGFSQYQRPAWSLDGLYIAVIRGGPGKNHLGYPQDHSKGAGTAELSRDPVDPGIGQLQILPVSGGSIIAVADSVPLFNNVSFSVDGKHVTFDPELTTHNLFGTKIDTPTTQIVERDMEGKHEKVVAEGWPTGGVSTILICQRSVSPDGLYIVYSRAEDLYLVPVCRPVKPYVIYATKGIVQPIRFAKGIDPHWEQEGKILSWSFGNKFYRINPDKVIKAVEKLPQGPQANPDDHVTRVNVQPDETIDLKVTAPSDYGHGIIALTNARLLTMKGDQVIEKGTVVISNGRFTSVGPSSNIVVPKLSRVINLQGLTIMPGFVDLHLHMSLADDIVPQQSWMYLASLAYGATTARDPATNYDSFGQSELLQSGQMLGPRLFSSGRAVDENQNGNIIDNAGDALNTAQMRQLLGGTFTKQYKLPTRLQREWLLQASRQTGLNMTNEGDQLILYDVAMLKDGTTGIEHNIDWGDTYKDLIDLFAKSGTWLTPTLQVRPGYVNGQGYFDSKYWHSLNSKIRRFTTDFGEQVIRDQHFDSKDSTALVYAAGIDGRIRKAGGNVTLGSHGEDQGIGVHNELWALQMGGLTNMQALQAATIMGAEALGIQKDVGSIEPGKIADLVILYKNPLDDIHNSREIKYVMKDGILYDGDTLDEIWPVKKKCPDWRLHVKDAGVSTNSGSNLSKPTAGDKDID